nr:probable serine/threonine-protein kinase DDB_G0282963 [Dermatophagoides farinae]
MMMLMMMVVLFNFYSKIIIVDANPLKENPRAIHHSTTTITSLNWSLPLISMLNARFQTAPTVFPCLDTFDVRLFWEVHRIDDYYYYYYSGQQYTQSSGPIVKSTNNDNLNVRHLIRLYWTKKDIVDKVLSAAVKHQRQLLHRHDIRQRRQRKPMWTLFTAHNRSWPSLSHFLNSNYDNNNNNIKKRKIRNKKIRYTTNLTNLHHHNSQPSHFFYSTRPSTLIEMKKFHYVREYSLDMESDDHDNHIGVVDNNNNDGNAAGGGGGLIKIPCDSFQPSEDIYYCIVYLILHKSAVLYENIPHCIPTIDRNIEQNGHVQLNGSTTLFRNIFVDGQHRAVSSSSLSYPSEIKFNYNTNNDESVMSNNNKETATITETFNENNSFNEYKSFIQKNRLDENHSMSTSINHNAFMDVRALNNSSVNRIPSNIRLIQKKQNAFQPMNHDSSNSLGEIETVIVQTHACSCKFDSNTNHVNQKIQELDLKTLNVNNKKTIIINLMITTCSKIVRKKFYESKSALLDHYLFNHIVDPNAYSDADVDDDDDDDVEEKRHLKNSTKKKQRNKRKKNNKIRIDQANNNNNNADSEKQIPIHNKNDDENNNNNTNMENKMNEFDIYNQIDSNEYYHNNPTVCIISIDKPEKYSFELKNIEPSIEWLSENPMLATYFTETLFNNNDNHNNNNNVVNDEDSSIDYSHFLVVRNGRSSIDPQLNIENRSQIHYIQSKHIRLEALSSMNLTLKFQQRLLYHKERDYNNNNNHDDDDDDDDNDNDNKHLLDHLFVNICRGFYSWIKQTVSMIAVKAFRLNKLANTQTVSTRKTTTSVTYAYTSNILSTNNIIEQQNNELSMINMPTFHIVSIILSIFIVLTFLIYAIIAFYGYMNNDYSHENIATKNNDDDDDDNNNKTFVRGHTVVTNNNDHIEKSIRNHNQRNKNNDNANNNRNSIVVHNGINSIITTSNEIKSIDDDDSISIDYHRTCDKRQQQSSQLDYYDIYEPLTTTKTIDASKSITNKIPFVNEQRQIVINSNDGSTTFQHSLKPSPPPLPPLLSTAKTVTRFGGYNNDQNNHTPFGHYRYCQSLPINQDITKQQQQTLPSSNHNDHHIQPVHLKTFMNDQNHYK